jgi:hypothetical protein
VPEFADNITCRTASTRVLGQLIVYSFKDTSVPLAATKVYTCACHKVHMHVCLHCS